MPGNKRSTSAVKIGDGFETNVVRFLNAFGKARPGDPHSEDWKYACVLAEPGDIVYPKLDEARDMITFDSFLPAMLETMGYGLRACASTDEALAAMRELNASGAASSRAYPVEFFGSDTDGEKAFEEFFTNADDKDETRFVNLGVVKNAKRRPVAEVEAIFTRLHAVFDKAGSTKEDVVDVLKEYLPNFNHISKGKSLDGRM